MVEQFGAEWDHIRENLQTAIRDTADGFNPDWSKICSECTLFVQSIPGKYRHSLPAKEWSLVLRLVKCADVFNNAPFNIPRWARVRVEIVETAEILLARVKPLLTEIQQLIGGQLLLFS